MQNFKFYFNKTAKVLDVVIHGSGVNMDSPFMTKVYDACCKMQHSVISFNFPFIDRGEEKSSGLELFEEIATINEILAFAYFQNYEKVRLIGKSLGGIATSYFLKTLPTNQQLKYEVVVLGYVTGNIDLINFPGKIVIIQGQNDRFGNIETVKNDLISAASKDITFIEIPEADHSYRDPQTKAPIFEDQAVSNICTIIQH